MGLVGLLTSSALAGEKPNIIFIFADDMGVGDVSHTTGRAPTPHLDRLAKEGMQFTDAHTTSSVCTPSRYGLLTGRYNWRTRLQKWVFSKPECQPLIKEGESTVASLLKSQGYDTAIVGKWHLGIGWHIIDGSKPKKGQTGPGWNIDYIKPAVTPTSNGFDYFYGIAASLDMPPYVYIHNNKAIQVPSVSKGVPSIKGGIARVGAAASDFEANECLKVFAQKSVEYINEQKNSERPFFLYLPLTSPHTPIVPSKEWLGKSPIGKYGDFLMETDWVVGEVLKALDDNQLAANTLIIFSTDNGCSPAANIKALQKKGHFPSGELRGHKADIYEGGHRVPTIARWPKVIKPGTKTDRLTTLADFYATCAEITGVKMAPKAGVDSVSFLPSLKNPKLVDRSAIVMHSATGSFAIRQGDWKLCFCGGSAGWSKPAQAPPGAPKWQLYNLKDDLAETKNLYDEHPERVKELHSLMLEYITNGRSTPGPKQANDVKGVSLGKEKRKKSKTKK
ncbi:arylsulfatase [Verrucomicrobiaceae bacterium N1E253]|uniref:Arylsulfatase n=2 Tax=Oceaniferula marina TaxID=2748318 RepID=A0A851GDL5_9BACT|nr:arylsulfatase [Oceaniferula marina]